MCKRQAAMPLHNKACSQLAAIGTQSPKWLRGRKIELKIVPAITDR